MSALLPFDEALTRILADARPVTESEQLALAQADGRVLSHDVTARLTQPPFDASSMDGYALAAADAMTGAELTVCGLSAAGQGWSGPLEPGQAIRIFTGAPVPEGADCVIMQEDAELLPDGRIRLKNGMARGANIRPRGQDFTEGEAALKAGTVLGFSHLTLIAAMDHASVAVRRKPLVAILATGNELVLAETPRGKDQIVASSGYGVAALARRAGADVLDLGIAADDENAITAAVERAMTARADILVTLGGASVGDHDLVQPVLKNMGMALDFWRIAMRPGKPLMVGRLGAMRVLGLPGNPVSTLVCSLLFLEPLVRRLAGLGALARSATARAASTIAANDHRQDYLRARLETAMDGTLTVLPAPKQDSSQMKTLAHSDCLIVRAPHAPPLAAGEPCPILLLHI